MSPVPKGTYTVANLWPADLETLHYIQARLTMPSYVTKTRKSKRPAIRGIPSVLHLVINSYVKRFKRDLPF